MRRVVSGAAKHNMIVSTSKRHLPEPLSTWWLASWVMTAEFAFLFWFPVLAMDLLLPGFVYTKLPTLHYLEEKRAEAKLRKVLDATYTTWGHELESGRLDEAISRTF